MKLKSKNKNVILLISLCLVFSKSYVIKTRKYKKNNNLCDQLDLPNYNKCKIQQDLSRNTERKQEEMPQVTITNDDRDTRDLQTWFIGLINEGFPVPTFLKGSSVVNSFYGGVNRAGLQLAGAALLGTGGYLYLNSVNAVPSLEFVGKSLDTIGTTVLDTAKDKLVLPQSFNGEFSANNKVDDGIAKLEVVYEIPGPPYDYNIQNLMNLTSKKFDSLESPSQNNDNSLSLEYFDKKKDLFNPPRNIEPIIDLDKPHITYKEKTYKQRLKEDFAKQLQQNWRNKYLYPTQKLILQKPFLYYNKKKREQTNPRFPTQRKRQHLPKYDYEESNNVNNVALLRQY